MAACSRVAVETIDDFYANPHDVCAYGYWISLLPEDLKVEWGIQDVKPPPWFTLEKCSLQVLKYLRMRGLPVYFFSDLDQGAIQPDEGMNEKAPNEGLAEEPSDERPVDDESLFQNVGMFEQPLDEQPLDEQPLEERLADYARLVEYERLLEEERVAQERCLAEYERLAEEERLAKEERLAEEERLAQEQRVAEDERMFETVGMFDEPPDADTGEDLSVDEMIRLLAAPDKNDAPSEAPTVRLADLPDARYCMTSGRESNIESNTGVTFGPFLFQGNEPVEAQTSQQMETQTSEKPEKKTKKKANKGKPDTVPSGCVAVIKTPPGNVTIYVAPATFASASTTDMQPAQSAAAKKKKKKKNRKKKRTFDSKRTAKQLKKARSTGPETAFTFTATKMKPTDIPEDMKTSTGASGVVAPKKDHESSDNSKTDVMPANPMAALGSPHLTASALELLGSTGPLYVDIEKWQENCSDECASISSNPIIKEPKAFSEQARAPSMRPTRFDPRETWSAMGDFAYTETVTVSAQRAQQLSPISHLGRHSPSQAVGQSDDDQLPTHCQSLSSCTLHSQGMRAVDGEGRRSCCCVHQPLHCQLQASPLEGLLTSEPQLAVMPGQSEWSEHGQQQQVSRQRVTFASPLTGETRGRREDRPMRFVEDIEHEMHAWCGVKEGEKSVGEELAPVVSSLFQSVGGVVRASQKEENVNSSSSSSSTPTVRKMISSTQHSSPSSLTPTMRAIQQEVILPAPRPEGEDQTPSSLYFTPRQLLDSSPSGSEPAEHLQMLRRDSPSSAGPPVAGSGKSDVATRNIAVVEHLKTLFETTAFADLQIALRPSANPTSEPLQFSVHKAIVSAFPFLRDVLQAKSLQGEPVDTINAFTGPGFTNGWAFRMALATRYGGNLVRIEEIRYHALRGMGWVDHGELGYYPFSLDLVKAEFALCYAAAGAFMGAVDVVERGIRMAIQLLTWSTVELIMSFGMAVENFMITCPDLVYHSPGEGNTPSPETGPRPVDPRMEHVPEFKYMWAQMALGAAVQWVVSEMKPDFQLYDRGQATFTPTRIPAALHTVPGSQCTDFRVENIQFGSMPSIASLRPTRVDFIVPSGLLITLPYEMLMAIVDAMKVHRDPQVLTIDLLREIVEVRESRRLHAIRIYNSRGQERDTEISMIPKDELAVLGYREFVNFDESDHEEGFPLLLRASLQREWVGLN